MTRAAGIRAACLLLLCALPVAAQAPAGDPLSNAGVQRASAVVDSVFVDRTATLGQVGGGDWVSYLMARLGATPIRDDLTVRVAVDTTSILISGQLSDLPRETRAAMGPVLAMMDSNSTIAAQVGLESAGTGVVRFLLLNAFVNGFPLPPMILQPVMAEIGRRYPVLTGQGRELLVQVPPDGAVALVPGAIRLSMNEPAKSGAP